MVYTYIASRYTEGGSRSLIYLRVHNVETTSTKTPKYSISLICKSAAIDLWQWSLVEVPGPPCAGPMMTI